MRRVTVRQMRELLPDIEAALAAEGEMVLTRRGRPIARLVPVAETPAHPLSTATLRARTPPLVVPSEVLLRQERDER
jgi:antitoxin (DNA-binding transcriptional repressor) of toxin-antitoxin stability system